MFPIGGGVGVDKWLGEKAGENRSKEEEQEQYQTEIDRLPLERHPTKKSDKP